MIRLGLLFAVAVGFVPACAPSAAETVPAAITAVEGDPCGDVGEAPCAQGLHCAPSVGQIAVGVCVSYAHKAE
jgi:hypothetical protein